MTPTLSPAGMKHLRDFKLSGMARTVPVRLEEAGGSTMTHQEFLELLLEDEANQRSDNRRKKLYQGAHLPFEKGIEDFFNWGCPIINIIWYRCYKIIAFIGVYRAFKQGCWNILY